MDKILTISNAVAKFATLTHYLGVAGARYTY